jgi:PAS domain S-box-containing protein
MRDGPLPLRYIIQAIAESIFSNPKQNGRKKEFYHQRHNELCDATEGIIMINTEGKIVQLSASAAVLFSYRAAELQGRPIQLLIPDADFLVSRTAISNLQPEGYVARKKNGIEFWVKLMVSYSQYPQDRHAFIWVSARSAGLNLKSGDT